MSNIRIPNKKLEEYYAAQGSCCYYCKTKTPFNLITRDHVFPKSHGHGLQNNSVFACRKCNSTHKGNKTPEEFRLYILKLIANKLKKIVKHKFIATQSDVDVFRKYHKMLMSVSALINNNYRPVFV